MTGPTPEQLRSLRDQNRSARNLAIEDLSARGQELRGLRADGSSFVDCDLREADLSEVSWTDCKLRDLRLDGSLARFAIMRMCVLEHVRAADGDWSGAKLENSQLVAIDFDRACLIGASFIDSDLTRASLCGANLRDVDASGAVLRGADLRGADLSGASLVDADLRGADLRGAIFADTDLDGADVRGATFVDEAPAEPTDTQAEPGAAPTQPEAQQWGQILEAVGPLVSDIVEQGRARGVLDERALQSIAEGMGELGVSAGPPGQSPLSLDGPVKQILQRVNEVGVLPLMSALQQGGEAPPPEVAAMLRRLMGDLRLDASANVEDLAAELVQQLIPQDTAKTPPH